MAKYKQPGRLNAVSVVLALLAAAAAYVGYRAWPLFVLRTEAKDALSEALPGLYRANLLSEPDSTIAAEDVRARLLERLTALGVREPEKAVAIRRDSEEVAIAVTLESELDLPPLRRRIPVKMAPRVRTSAARVTY